MGEKKKVLNVNFCDKCGSEMERKCGIIIERLSAQISEYDPRGSGGHSVKGLEFCYSCSADLYVALGLDQGSLTKRRDKIAQLMREAS